jgi:exonuclease III
MTRITTYLSILMLNVNVLNPPSKDTIWQTGLKGKIQQSVVYRRLIDRNWFRVKGWKKIYQANGHQKQAGVAILNIRQSRLQTQLIKGDKEEHFILTIKGEIHQKEITIINIYAPSVSAPNFIKHTLKDI